MDGVELPPSSPKDDQKENLNTPSSFPENQYGNPAINSMDTPKTILRNQRDFRLSISPEIYKTTSVSIICNKCKKPITTDVKKEFNCCSCLSCFCTCFIFFAIIQFFRKKDICCYDATHICPYCGNIIAKYQSC